MFREVQPWCADKHVQLPNRQASHQGGPYILVKWPHMQMLHIWARLKNAHEVERVLCKTIGVLRLFTIFTDTEDECLDP